MFLPTPAPIRPAETDFVWVIVPFSRPENLNLVLSNFNRQTFPKKKLVLVENGRAVGAAHGIGIGSDSRHSPAPLVLTSERHQSIAKNTALKEIRQRGGGFTVVMDDDDWYGPEFVAEAAGYARTYDIIGKVRHFTSVDGHLWLCARERALRPARTLAGSTIACWAERCPDYPMDKVGEEAALCNRAERMGMSIFATDIYHYVCRRSSGGRHTWPITNERLREHESACHALDLGEEDLDIVTGAKRDVQTVLLAPRIINRPHANTGT